MFRRLSFIMMRLNEGMGSPPSSCGSHEATFHSFLAVRYTVPSAWFKTSFSISGCPKMLLHAMPTRTSPMVRSVSPCGVCRRALRMVTVGRGNSERWMFLSNVTRYPVFAWRCWRAATARRGWQNGTARHTRPSKPIPGRVCRKPVLPPMKGRVSRTLSA